MEDLLYATAVSDIQIVAPLCVETSRLHMSGTIPSPKILTKLRGPTRGGDREQLLVAFWTCWLRGTRGAGTWPALGARSRCSGQWLSARLSIMRVAPALRRRLLVACVRVYLTLLCTRRAQAGRPASHQPGPVTGLDYTIIELSAPRQLGS